MIEEDDLQSIKDLVKQALSEIIEESQLEPEITEDVIGLQAVSGFYHYIADLAAMIDAELEAYGYKMSTSNAYSLTAAVLEYCIDEDIIEDDDIWRKLIQHFNTRADEFATMDDTMDIEPISHEPYRWTGLLDSVVWHIKVRLDTYADDGDFTISERILALRSSLLSLRNSGYLDYSWPWFKNFIAILHEDWKIHGGGFGSSMGTGDPPWSHG